MPTIAGKLRHRITFQSPTTTDGDHGGTYETWGDAFTVWASVGPIRGREYWELKKSNSEIEGKIVMRYREDITPEKRVMFKGRPLKILSVLNPAERREYLEVYYKEWQ